ncbi:MAG: prephenate dehydrogenase [Christensenella sp.]|nr:prephenate dehydrogenase [Christensenella sp.]
MNIGIIGLGLIGGSIGRAIKKKTNHVVYGLDKDEKTMIKATLVEAIDAPLDDANVKDVDILIIALYPKAIIDCIKEYAPKLKDGAIIIDCGGNKREICKFMEQMHITYPNIDFIGGHPMAGREFSGFSHSTASLFEKATMLMVPIHNSIETLYKVKEFILELGFEGVVITNPTEHDEMISFTSQLAHIVSSSYIKNPLTTTHYGFSAGSFKDMTRVAKLNPEMWTEIMLDNKDYLIAQIDVLIKNLENFKKAMQENDKEELSKLLDEGRAIKEEAEKLRNEKTSQRIK